MPYFLHAKPFFPLICFKPISLLYLVLRFFSSFAISTTLPAAAPLVFDIFIFSSILPKIDFAKSIFFDEITFFLKRNMRAFVSAS